MHVRTIPGWSWRDSQADWELIVSTSDAIILATATNITAATKMEIRESHVITPPIRMLLAIHTDDTRTFQGYGEYYLDENRVTLAVFCEDFYTSSNLHSYLDLKGNREHF